VAAITNFSAAQGLYFMNLLFDNSALPWRTFGDNCMPGRPGVTQKFSTACNETWPYLIQNGYIRRTYGPVKPVTNYFIQNYVNSMWTAYGVQSSIIYASLWPDPRLVIQALSSPLLKRSQVFGSAIGRRSYPCNKDNDGNPYQDCLNMLAVWCAFDSHSCKSAVDTTFSKLNQHWNGYLQSCASWRNSNNYEQANSDACKRQTTYFLGNVTTISTDPEYKQPINDAFTSSIYQRLWYNQTILRSRTDTWTTKFGIQQY